MNLTHGIILILYASITFIRMHMHISFVYMMIFLEKTKVVNAIHTVI